MKARLRRLLRVLLGTASLAADVAVAEHSGKDLDALL